MSPLWLVVPGNIARAGGWGNRRPRPWGNRAGLSAVYGVR